MHYLSDVWAGYLVGTLWLIIGISLSEWLSATGRLAWRVPVEASRRRAAIGLGMAALIGYLGFASHWQPPRHTPPSAATVEITRPINEILREQHIAHAETLFGEPTQPLAFAIIARDADALLSALGSAGWRPADRAGLRTMLRLARQGMDYTTAPLAPAFWNRRINDFALERAMGQGGQGGNRSIATVRLWRTPYGIPGTVYSIPALLPQISKSASELNILSPESPLNPKSSKSKNTVVPALRNYMCFYSTNPFDLSILPTCFL